MKDFGPLASNVCMLGPFEQNVSVQGSTVSVNHKPESIQGPLAKGDWWKGFGLHIGSSTALYSRPLSYAECFRLDKHGS